MKLTLEQIRERSRLYAFGQATPLRPRITPDERWIRAYEEAWLVCGYQGRSDFQLDGIVVTVLEAPRK